MGKNAWPKGDLEHSHPVNYDTITIQVALKRKKKAHCIINETYYVSLVILTQQTLTLQSLDAASRKYVYVFRNPNRSH
jgi:hypothetical protein